MKAYLAGRNVVPLTVAITAFAVFLFTQLGALPLPALVPEGVDIGVPIRSVGLVALGSIPLLAGFSPAALLERSGARPSWILQVGPPAVLTLMTVVLVSALAGIAGMDGAAMVRNVLFGTCSAALFHKSLGPVSFLPGLLVAMLAATLREEHAWWSLTNHPGSPGQTVVIGLTAVAAVALNARFYALD